MKDSQHRCVIVLGSHRSGTSVLARSLVAVGVDLGERLIGPQFDNPKGFFEDQVASEIDETFLRHIGFRSDTLILPAAIAPEAVAEYQNRIKNEVCNRFSNKPLWGLKDPRISRLWHFWMPVLADVGVQPVFILANRHPLSVAQSLARRNHMPEAQALALWAVHQLAGLEALAQHGGLVVDYDLMMDTPSVQLQRLARFLNVANQLDPDEVSRFEGDFLTDGLRHSRHDHVVKESASSALQLLCLEIYKELRGLAQLPEGFDAIHAQSLREMVEKFREKLGFLKDLMRTIDGLWQASRAPTTSLLESEIRLYVSESTNGEPAAYTEARGAAALYPVSGQRQSLSLTLPTDLKPLARMRLDPANQSIVFVCHALSLVSSGDDTFWCWDGGRDLFRNVFGLLFRECAEGLMVLCLNDDPQFELAIPDEVLAQVGPGTSLVVELTPRTLADTLPTLLAETSSGPLSVPMTSTALAPVGLARELAEVAQLMKTQVQRRNETIASQRAELESLKARQQALEIHVVRAEAQLDLLKEFVLPEGAGRIERL